MLVAAGCGSTTTSYDLEQDAATLGSLAAEGSLIADDISRGRSTSAFARVHLGEMARQARGLEQTLGSSRPVPAVGTKARQAEQVARTVASALERLRASYEDRARARRLAEALERAAKAAEELGE